MRCARATRRSAAVAAVAAAAPTTSLCLDGFTAIHRRDYYPVSPLRLLCTTTRPVHDTSRSIRLSSFPSLSPHPPNLYRPRFSFALSGISLRRLGAMDARETTTTTNTPTHANDNATSSSAPHRTRRPNAHQHLSSRYASLTSDYSLVIIAMRCP